MWRKYYQEYRVLILTAGITLGVMLIVACVMLTKECRKNESSAIYFLRQYADEQERFHKKNVFGQYAGDLQDLCQDTNDLSMILYATHSDASRYGYRFALVTRKDTSENGLLAFPESYGITGQRSFFMTATGTLYSRRSFWTPDPENLRLSSWTKE